MYGAPPFKCYLFSDIYKSFPNSVILIGGDLTNNFKNKPRYTIWTHFLAQYEVAQIELTKPTYHHHIGDGVFDSFIDRAFLINPPQHVSISLIQQLCPLTTPILDSKHDALIVKFQMPISQNSPPDVSKAPTVDFTPIRIKWTHSGIADFSTKVSPILDQLVANFTISSSKALFDVFLSSVI